MPELYAVTDPVTGRDVQLRLRASRNDAAWELDAFGRKPGHGLLVLRTARVSEGERVADLGAGPLALFAQFAAQMGATYAEAVEIDPNLAASAAKACAAATDVHIVQGDLADVSRTALFDQVFVHLPMLPVGASTNGDFATTGAVGRDVASNSKCYHVGGTTGREILDRAIAVAQEILAVDGTLIIAQFEFLGVEARFADLIPSTFETLHGSGFLPLEVHHYTVPLTSELRDDLDTIRAIYPKYEFGPSGDETHRFSVVHAVRHA